jgi:hypothetical protein
MKRPTAVRVFGRNYTITYVPAPSYGEVPMGNCENDTPGSPRRVPHDRP